MNIKEVEQMTDLKKANIRYYEQEGLLTPSRNESNNYREYSMEDVETLKKIKCLRLLGVPIHDIKALQQGRRTLSGLMREREQALAQEIEQMQQLTEVCRKIEVQCDTFESLDAGIVNMRNGLFAMRGEKVMRLDRIHQLEKYDKMAEKAVIIIFLAFFPLQWALKLSMGYELPEYAMLLWGAIMMTAGVMRAVCQWKIQANKRL